MPTFQISGFPLLVNIDNGAALRGTVFEVATTTGRVGLRFVFNWNTKHQFYTVDIYLSNGERLGQWDLTDKDCSRLLKGLEPNSETVRDALVYIESSEGNDNPPSPATIGLTHQMFILTGKEIRA